MSPFAPSSPQLLDHDRLSAKLFLVRRPLLQQPRNLPRERLEPVLHALAQETVLLLDVVEEECHRRLRKVGRASRERRRRRRREGLRRLEKVGWLVICVAREEDLSAFDLATTSEALKRRTGARVRRKCRVVGRAAQCLGHLLVADADSRLERRPAVNADASSAGRSR